MIHTYIPYCPKDQGGYNLGWTYNTFMKLVDEDDWVCFLDHDATFTTRNWYHQLEDIIKEHTDVGLFTAVTNRIGQPAQVIDIDDKDNHDIAYHRKIGKKLQKKYSSSVSPFNNPEVLLSGVVILISKKTWRLTGGFADGFLRVDRNMHERCLDKNIKVGLMDGVYVYHWYRGDGDIAHIHGSRGLFDTKVRLTSRRRRNSIL